MSTYVEPTKLGELNAALAKLGLPSSLTPAELGQLAKACEDEQKEGRARLLSALRIASHPDSQGSLGAMAFLRRVLEPYTEGKRQASASVTSIADRLPPQDAAGNVATHESHEREVNTHRRDDARQPADRERKSEQVKVFGARAALCVETDTTRGNVPTVRFEFATAVGERKYDWSAKLTVQLTQDEIIQAATVFFGFATKVEFKNHGGDEAKWLSIEHQGTNLFIKGGNKHQGSLRAVPVDASRATAIAALITSQLDKALFGAGRNGTLMPLLRNVAAAMMTGAPTRKAG